MVPARIDRRIGNAPIERKIDDERDQTNQRLRRRRGDQRNHDRQSRDIERSLVDERRTHRDVRGDERRFKRRRNRQPLRR